jgi:hypothetical protein
MKSKLKVVFYFLIVPFIIYNVFLLTVFPSQGEVHLSNDIGRDFLLLQELDQKKIVLIGPRSNTQGVFHGPLWTYMNYPAYLIGQGNPVVVAWFWVILGVIFLLTTFFIVRKLFGTFAATLAVALLAVDLVPHINSVFSPEALFFFIPFFLFTIYKYLQTKKAYFLALHFIIIGLLVHLNIGVGILFALLSTGLSLSFIIKNKLFKHLIAYFCLPIVVSNFIIFDLRHGFNITKALLNLGGSSKFLLPLGDWLNDRITNLLSMQILTNNTFSLSIILFSLILFLSILEIKRKSKQKNFLLLLIFYYFGYMLLSYFNKGIILYHYIYVLIPLSALWLAALAKGSYRIIFITVILIVIYLNFNSSISNLNYTQKNIVGKSPDSWKALNATAKSVIDSQKGKEFGYFVYSPDAFAYQQRYAMLYSFKADNAKAFEYTKKPTTYVISSPHPVDNPYMEREWWIKNEAKISSSPVETKHLPGGYTVDKFNLTPDEQKIAHDPNIELLLHFR